MTAATAACGRNFTADRKTSPSAGRSTSRGGRPPSMPPSPDVPPPPASPRAARAADARAAMLLVALVLLAFWPVLRAGFVNWDDTDMVVHNRDLHPPTLAN